ncbi:hypothetical protein D3874_18085 [Oleomonas cavernae]|uniref:Uncharacterized protein n=1 Tax=Oleomonas cavernae TaxID=2320859 RepID=A0A418WF71_9PROT|nr:hypothetical protein D3874_18085 [Oleomonas cavernae]
MAVGERKITTKVEDAVILPPQSRALAILTRAFWLQHTNACGTYRLLWRAGFARAFGAPHFVL